MTAAVIAAGRKPRGRAADLMIAALTENLTTYTTNPADVTDLDALIRIVLSPGHLPGTNSHRTAIAQVWLSLGAAE